MSDGQRVGAVLGATERGHATGQATGGQRARRGQMIANSGVYFSGLQVPSLNAVFECVCGFWRITLESVDPVEQILSLVSGSPPTCWKPE